MNSETLPVRLVARRALSKTVSEVVLETTDQSPFVFTAGQHIALTAAVDGEVLTSYYSIASPPDGSPRFALCVKTARDGGGLGEALGEMAEGAAALVSQPGGEFRLQHPARPLVFVSAGTGIAPLRSMALSAMGTAHSILFLQGARDRADLLYREAWEACAGRDSKFQFWPVLSRPRSPWQGLRGYVQDHLATALAQPIAQTDVYLCGATAMVEACVAQLRKLGVDPGQIHFEKYG